MQEVNCPRCGRILGKFAEDGVLHVKLRKDGPRLLIDISKSEVLAVCPSVVYSSTGKVLCGERTFISSELIKRKSAREKLMPID